MLDRLDRLRHGLRPPPDPREAVRDLVLLVSSSRGGSSVFAEALRRLPGTLHLRAEVNPFLRLAGFGWPESGARSDALDAQALGDADAFARQLSWDIGRPAAHQSDLDRDLVWRLRVQWPALPLDDAALLALVRAVPGSPADDPTGFHIALLRRLHILKHRNRVIGVEISERFNELARIEVSDDIVAHIFFDIGQHIAGKVFAGRLDQL